MVEMSVTIMDVINEILKVIFLGKCHPFEARRIHQKTKLF